MARHQLVPTNATLLTEIGEKACAQAAKAMDIAMDLDVTTGMTVGSRSGHIVVLIPERTVDSSDLKLCSVIAHEAVHVVDELWEFIGERNNTTEMRAYYVEWLLKLIYADVEKYRRRRATDVAPKK